MPVLRTGPDVAAALLTAERTMTRAGDLNGGIDAGGAIRERPPPRKGILVAHVATAAPVAPSQQESLGRRLHEMTGKQIQLEFNTDPALIGGVVTRVGSMVYDGSVKTQLHEIEQRLKQGDRV